MPSLSELGFGPILVSDDEVGTIRLRYLSVDDESFLVRTLGRDLPARELIVTMVHHQMVDPALDLATIQGWSERALELPQFGGHQATR